MTDYDELVEKLERIIAYPISRKDCKCSDWKWGSNQVCPTCTARSLLQARTDKLRMAVVKVEGELPEISKPEGFSSSCSCMSCRIAIKQIQAQQDMLKAGYVQEVKSE